MNRKGLVMDLSNDVKFVKGVGPNRVVLLNKLGIYTLKDLITYFPRDYEDRSKPKTIDSLQDGEEALIEGYAISRITEIKVRRNLTIYKLVIKDETRSMYYNMVQPTIFKENVSYRRKI